MMDPSRELDTSSFPYTENGNLEIAWKPKVGMEFESFEAAWKFWVNYGGKTGFGVRKQYANKSKRDGTITSCRFVCCKEGLRRKDKRDVHTINPRLETRTDCKARIALTYTNGKYKVHEFVEEHNHIVHGVTGKEVQGDTKVHEFVEDLNYTVQDVRANEVQGDDKLDITQRYRQLCSKLMRLATEVSSCQEAFLLVNKAVDELSEQAMDICKRQKSGDTKDRDTMAQENSTEMLSTQGIQEESWSKVKETPKKLDDGDTMAQENSIEMLSTQGNQGESWSKEEETPKKLDDGDATAQENSIEMLSTQGIQDECWSKEEEMPQNLD